MIDRIAFGQAVRKHREAADLSVAQLAEQVGVTARYIYQIEAGERMPSTGVVIRIASVLGVKLTEILERTQEKVDG